MRSLPRSASVACWSFIFAAVLVPCAHAYLDPGTGSMIVQVVIAAALGAAVSVRVFWKNISSAFRRMFRKDKSGS